MFSPLPPFPNNRLFDGALGPVVKFQFPANGGAGGAAGSAAPAQAPAGSGMTYYLWAAKEGGVVKIKLAQTNNGQPQLLATLTNKDFTKNAQTNINMLQGAAQSLAQASVAPPVNQVNKNTNMKLTAPAPSQLTNLAVLQKNLFTSEAGVESDILHNQCTVLSGCFRADVLLRTREGFKRVDEIKAGDWVASRSEFDPDGPIEWKQVEDKFERTGQILTLVVGGQEIGTTPEHPFYVQDRGWAPAGALEPGQQLRTDDGWVPLDEVRPSETYEKVYNLRVADFHTYFVGDESWGFAVWAHNQICGFKETPAARNASYARSFTDNPSITNPANIILKAERQARGMPRAGSSGDNATLAYVEVAGSTSPIFASNSDSYTYNFPSVGTGPGQLPIGQGVNLQARDHAEIKAMIHAAQTPGVDLRGKSITIYTDRDPCSFCDKSRGIENAARILGASSVTIWCPSGSIGPINLRT